MHHFKYVIYQEDEFYVSQCLNVNVASFGTTVEEALSNLKEAVELYCEDENGFREFRTIGSLMVGELHA